MRIVCLLICLAYWPFLTLLLLVANPAAVVGLRRIPMFPWGDIGIHFTAFMILSILAHGTRWPKRPCWLLIALLLVYGAITESLQAFVPPRTVELKDYIENFLGVLAGSGLYWLVQWIVVPRHTQPHVLVHLMDRRGAMDAANEWSSGRSCLGRLGDQNPKTPAE